MILVQRTFISCLSVERKRKKSGNLKEVRRQGDLPQDSKMLAEFPSVPCRAGPEVQGAGGTLGEAVPEELGLQTPGGLWRRWFQGPSGPTLHSSSLNLDFPQVRVVTVPALVFFIFYFFGDIITKNLHIVFFWLLSWHMPAFNSEKTWSCKEESENHRKSHPPPQLLAPCGWS